MSFQKNMVRNIGVKVKYFENFSNYWLFTTGDFNKNYIDYAKLVKLT